MDNKLPTHGEAEGARDTREAAHDRARELALLAGRPTDEVSMDDYLRARQEAGVDPAFEDMESRQESIPDSEQWNTVPAPGGSQREESPDEEEDEEGRSLSEQSAEQGVGKAEKEQLLEAAKAAESKDKGEA